MAKNFSQVVLSAQSTSNIPVSLRPKLQVWKASERFQIDHSAAAFFEQAMECRKVISELHRQRQADPASALDLIRQFVSELMLRESGHASGPQMLAGFFARYLAEPFVREYSQRLLLADSRRSVSAQIEELLSGFDDFAEWYLKRARSLAILTLEPQPDLFADGASAQIFDVTVLLDHKFCGCAGFYISCGVRLRGLLGEALILKGYLSDGEGVLRCAANWRDWGESSRSQGRTGAPQDPIFVCTNPLVPSAQDQLIDGIEFFIPYAALDLRQSRSAIFAELVLFSADGDDLARGRSADFNLGSLAKDAGLPSLNFLGLWPSEPGKGDLLRQVNAKLAWRQGSAGATVALRVSFDAVVVEQCRKTLGIGVRILNRAGEMLALDGLTPSAGSASHFEAFFSPAQSYAVLSRHTLNFNLPMGLVPQLHECLLELSIFEQDTNKILVGSLAEIESEAANVVTCVSSPSSALPVELLSQFESSAEKLYLTPSVDGKESFKVLSKVFSTQFPEHDNLSFFSLLRLDLQGGSRWISSDLICPVSVLAGRGNEICLTFPKIVDQIGSQESLECKIVAVSEQAGVAFEKRLQLFPTRFACGHSTAVKSQGISIVQSEFIYNPEESNALDCEVLLNIDPAISRIPAVFKWKVRLTNREGKQARFQKARTQSETISLSAELATQNVSGAYQQILRKFQVQITPYLRSLLLKGSKDLICEMSLESISGDTLETFKFPLVSALRAA